MCDWSSGAATVLNIGSSMMGMKAQARAAKAQLEAQYKQAVTDMNFAWSDLEQQRADAFDMSVSELSKVQNNKMTIGSSATTAIMENMSGRTADRLIRNVEGDYEDISNSIKENHSKHSNEIDLNKERAGLKARQQMEGYYSSAPTMPSKFTQAVTAAGIGLSHYTQYQNRRQTKKTGGKY